MPAIRRWNQEIAEGKGLFLGIYVKNILAGHVRSNKYRFPDQNKRWGISLEYWLSIPFQKRGLMHRLIPTFIDHAAQFFSPRVDFIEIVCHPDNKPSITVAQRLGFAAYNPEASLKEILPRLRFRKDLP